MNMPTTKLCIMSRRTGAEVWNLIEVGGLTSQCNAFPRHIYQAGICTRLPVASFNRGGENPTAQGLMD